MQKVIQDLSKKFFLLMLLAVTLSSCGDDAPDPAKPDFTFVTSPTVAGAVTFTNTSTNASSFVWDFGDGTTSTEVSPTHIYAANGTYQVTLNIAGSGKFPGVTGSGNGATKSVTVTNAKPSMVANMRGSSAFTFTATTVTASKTSSTITVQGVSGTTLQVRVPSTVTPGTYQVGGFNSNSFAIYYFTSSYSYGAYYGACSDAIGSITVTSVTPTSISGSFTGKVYRPDCAGFFTIESANFGATF